MRILRIIGDTGVAYIQKLWNGKYRLTICWLDYTSKTRFVFPHTNEDRTYKYKQSAVRYALNHL